MSSIWTIRRSATDGKVAGLCSAVAEHWGVDPVLVRVGCVLLALSSGVGVVLYLAGWLLIPVAGQDKAPVDDVLGAQARNWSREVRLGVVALCCIAALALLGPVTPFGFGPAVILVLIWYFSYYRNHPPGDTRSAPAPSALDPVPPQPLQFYSYPGPATAFTVAAEAWQRRVEEYVRTSSEAEPVPAPGGSVALSLFEARPAAAPDRAGAEPPGAESAGPASKLAPSPQFADQARLSFLAAPDPVGLYSDDFLAAPPALVPRSRPTSARRLRLAGLLGAVLTVSGLGLADHLGASVPLAAYPGAALLVVGLTLILATWLGRARGLLPIGLLLGAAVLATSVAGPLATAGGWRSEAYPVTSMVELGALAAEPPHLEMGELHLDLRALDLTTDTTVAASVDAGRLVVSVPEDVNVVVQYKVGAGMVTTEGATFEAGGPLEGSVTPHEPIAGAPTLTFELSVDQGQVQVQR